ncbi:MAG: peroxide stress protein YaaA [Alkalilacustris sp.]
MIVVISPAKRLDWSERTVAPTAPQFAPEAAELAEQARALSAADLARLMKLSPQLAKLNAERFRDFAPAPGPSAVRPAALAFAGDTYAGLEARTLSDDALRWAQDRLRILSGLYGVLRPLDAIQPYRLEMGTRMNTSRGRDLYAFWGDRIAVALTAAGRAAGCDWLLNCASQEYFGAVDCRALGLKVITPQFLEERPGGPKVISFHAKKARGAMARFVMEERITDPDAILSFEAGGYVHAPGLSTPDRPAFLRAA